MSGAQEQRRAKSWEAQHKQTHEDSVKKLREMKDRLDSLDTSSPEHAALKAKYDEDFKAAEAFFVKYYES